MIYTQELPFCGRFNWPTGCQCYRCSYAPDAAASLDLTLALQTIYERAGYDLSINYDQPPPSPELSEEEERLRHTNIATWRNNA